MGAATASVVIPVAEPCPRLPLLLGRLTGWPLASAGVQEVIIVDNTPGGSAAVEESVTAVSQTATVRTCLVRQEAGFSYSARNAGICAAQGDYIAFLDVDVMPTRPWLGALSALLEENTADRAAGPVVQVAFVAAESFLDRSAQLLDVFTGIPQDRYATTGWGATANLVVRRDVFDRLGLFDPTLSSGGDAEFGRRAHRAGVPMRFVPELTVEHEARSSLRALIRKAERVAAGHAHLISTMGRGAYERHFGVHRGPWWPLEGWLRAGLGLLIGAKRRDGPLKHRLRAALVAPLVGISAHRAFRRGLKSGRRSAHTPA
jgi:GT2 family glycosyltransferase